MPCRFNPAATSVGALGGILGNCVSSDNFTADAGNAAFEGGTGLGDFPVFIEPLLTETDNAKTSQWYIADAIMGALSLLICATVKGLFRLCATLIAQIPSRLLKPFEMNSF